MHSPGKSNSQQTLQSQSKEDAGWFNSSHHFINYTAMPFFIVIIICFLVKTVFREIVCIWCFLHTVRSRSGYKLLQVKRRCPVTGREHDARITVAWETVRNTAWVTWSIARRIIADRVKWWRHRTGCTPPPRSAPPPRTACPHRLYLPPLLFPA